MANQPRLPRIVLVEANVLSRTTDIALVERYSRSGNAEPVFFRPIRAAVAAYENWLHAPLSHAQVSFALNQLVEQPPSNFDSHIYADRAFQQFNAEDPSIVARMNARRIEQLIPDTERRGRACCFLSSPIRSNSKARDQRNLLTRSFTRDFQILTDGSTSITQEGICAGRMAFIWMSGPP